MWFSRIISSFFGIRKKNDLQDDLNKLSFNKIILLFITLNLIFISIVLLITKIFI
ncbi:MAG: DUF2970 domain-containing protein [Gammaproteobacteria bacterium]|nr:DUF2970 domain-containing protein [Gammaproteobacteria bacterium]